MEREGRSEEKSEFKIVYIKPVRDILGRLLSLTIPSPCQACL